MLYTSTKKEMGTITMDNKNEENSKSTKHNEYILYIKLEHNNFLTIAELYGMECKKGDRITRNLRAENLGGKIS